MKKYRVGILGATGMVGQRFATILADHPYFEITVLAASKRSEGKKYSEAVEGRWKLEIPMPKNIMDMEVYNVTDTKKIKDKVDFVFSAVDMKKDEIKAFEDSYAKAEIPVVSNNSAHRWTKDVPMVIPEINPEHIEIIKDQRKRLGTKRGFVAVKPNCSIQSYTPVLAAWKKFKPYEMIVSTYQAISGAGKNFETWPEMRENIIPYIGGEEEKSEKEPLKIFGHIENGEIVNYDGIKISSQCIRVPVLNGHTATCFIKLRENPSKDELIRALREYKGIPQDLMLPMAPKQFIQYLDEDNRPILKEDVDFERGMGISIGRLREDSIYDWKFVGLSHNTLRGAAGGAVLLAELLCAKGYMD